MTKLAKQQFELWGKVGFVINLAQMIEYNLANILAFDEILREFEDVDSMTTLEFNEFARRAKRWYKKFESKSLGVGVKRAEEIGFFEDTSQEVLKQICEERNYVVHRLFKEDLKLKKLETDPSYYFERLEKLITDMYKVNDELVEIFTKQKAEYKLIW